MIKCIPKTARHYGIQYTGDNREEICKELCFDKEDCQEWMNQDTKECYLRIKTKNLDLGRIQVKQWILLGEVQKDYLVMSDEDFRTYYEDI